MDHDIKTERRKKSDKSKEKYERNGKFTQKAVRAMEAVQEKRAEKGKDVPTKNKKN